MSNRIYICIDLKSFYASVECVERGLDPLKTNLVVADASRTEKTICLAVSPSLKKYGIPGRARLFEVVQKVREAERNNIANEFGEKQDEMMSGLVEMEDENNYYINLGKTQGLLPKTEIIPGETIKMGSNIKVYISKVDINSKGANKIGSTKKGIGPTYTDKYHRSGIRVEDLFVVKKLEVI